MRRSAGEVQSPGPQRPAGGRVAATLQDLSGGRFLLGPAAGAAEFLGWVGVDPTEFDAVRAALAGGDRTLARSKVTDTMLGLGIAGDVEDVIGRCRWLVDRGATHLSFGPPLGRDPAASIDLIGTEVLPSLR